MKIGILIKDEAGLLPKTNNKNLWSGIGKWHYEFFECVECNTTIYKHKAGGVCRKCYRKLYYENNHLKEKQYSKRYVKENPQQQDKKNEWKRRRREEANKFIDKAKKGEIKATPKIRNLLNNLENT